MQLRRNWKAIRKSLGSNQNAIQMQLKTIGKHLEFDWKAIGNNQNAIGKQVEINWKQLERMQLEEIVMQLESGLQAIGKAIRRQL